MFYACKKENISPVVIAKTGAILLKFDNRVGTEELILNNLFYKNNLDETYNVQTLSYQIADVELLKIDGHYLKITADTTLLSIDENDILNTWRKISNVPVGTYKGVRFNLKKGKNKTIFEQSGSIGTEKKPYNIVNTSDNIPISLSFADYELTVTAEQNRPSSPHITVSIKDLVKNKATTVPSDLLQKMFELSHIENY
jgi:hypothetical protein